MATETMSIEDLYNKMIGIFSSLQKQLFYQIERIEELELLIIEVRRKIG